MGKVSKDCDRDASRRVNVWTGDRTQGAAAPPTPPSLRAAPCGRSAGVSHPLLPSCALITAMLERSVVLASLLVVLRLTRLASARVVAAKGHV